MYGSQCGYGRQSNSATIFHCPNLKDAKKLWQIPAKIRPIIIED